jgi:hypothetical protein
LELSALPLNQLADECQAAGLIPENATKIALALSRTFGVHDDEVAIFKVEQAQLRFIFPLSLTKVGMIPLSNATSVAARTANAKRPEAINSFAQMRHASFFESVPVDSKTRNAQKPEKVAMVIQKMMSVPVIGAAGVLGVIQISRKGSSPKAAGPDFQPTDLQKLVSAAAVLAKCFK